MRASVPDFVRKLVQDTQQRSPYAPKFPAKTQFLERAKTKIRNDLRELVGAPGKIRTPNLLIRSQCIIPFFSVSFQMVA